MMGIAAHELGAWAWRLMRLGKKLLLFSYAHVLVLRL
jgi:hypothetical protein